MELRERRVVSRLVRFGLVALAVIIGLGWLAVKRSPRTDHIRIEGAAPAVEALAPGDLRIFNEDSTVDVILAGDRISAGLSAQKLQAVREDLARSSAKDTSGLGGSIAQLVKSTVADKLGIRAVYPVADIADMRWDAGRILVTWTDGKESTLLGDNIRIDNDRNANRFRREDAERLIAAVRARRP